MPDMEKLSLNGNTYDVRDSRVAGALNDIANLQTDKEDVNNKTDVLDQDSTAAQYPNAECVYNALQASKQFSEVTYGTTTNAEVDAILAAGKIPFCWYGSRCYVYSTTTTYYHTFVTGSYLSTMTFYGINLLRSNSSWSATITSAVTTITSSSNNSQIPTAKAVYDYVTTEIANVDVKLYRHNIVLSYDPGLGISQEPELCLITKSSTPMAIDDVREYLYVNHGGVQVPAAGTFSFDGLDNDIVTAISATATHIYLYGFKASGNGTYVTSAYPYATFVVSSDTVVEVS